MQADRTANDLPLYDLFDRLRRAGLPLGIDEYQAALRALQGGFGIADRAALKRMCSTLWVKSLEEQRIFNEQFEQAIPPPPAELAHAAPSTASATRTSDTPQPQPPSPSSIKTPAPLSPTPSSSLPPPPESAGATDLSIHLKDEVQATRAILLAAAGSDDDLYGYMLQTDEYFPITRRQMKQSWRYLRRAVREGPPVELDVEGTIKEIARQGMLLAPVLQPLRTNRTELLLLIDHDGSMVPFHALSRRLADTAQRGGKLGSASIFYFHNCPLDYLYRDIAHQEAENIQDVLSRVHGERTGVLIFSDAGAARGGSNRERADMTVEFLALLRQQVRYVAWLNPMPRLRWQGTTAAKIMQSVPMFDLSRRGLDDAIGVLRGRPVPFALAEVGK